MQRACSACGQTYYGDLGHRGCEVNSRNKKSEETPDEIAITAGLNNEQLKDHYRRMPVSDLKKVISRYDLTLDLLSKKELRVYSTARGVLEEIEDHPF